MKFMWAPCWLGDDGRFLPRHTKWLNWNLPLLGRMDLDAIVLFDNASPIDELKKLQGTIYDESFNVPIFQGASRRLHILRYKEFLPRISHLNYPYVYRAFQGQDLVIKHFNASKSVYLDTDYFVLSNKCLDFIKNTNNGWVSTYSQIHKFPESSFSILNKDHFNAYRLWSHTSWDHFENQCFETLIPFSEINKELNGDRWGELVPPKPLEQGMDFYGQTLPDFDIKWIG